MDSVPLALIPGLNCTPALFAPLEQTLRSRACLYVDHGRDDSIAAIAERFLRQAPPRFALAGLSMGGYVALEIARQAPERVERLALLDTRASPDSAEDKERRERLIRFAEEGRFADVHGVLWQRLVHPSRLPDKRLEMTVKAMMMETGAAAFINQQRAVMARADYRGGLAAMQIPTLVLVGEQDQITPVDHARELAAGIPGAQLTIVPDCGHLSTLERPSLVDAALTRWLN